MRTCWQSDEHIALDVEICRDLNHSFLIEGGLYVDTRSAFHMDEKIVYSKRVLLFEGSGEQDSFLQDLLRRRGANMLCVNSSESAREALLNALEHDSPFDCIVMVWPDDAGSETFLGLLLQDEVKTIPVLVLVSTLQDGVITWMNDRHRCELLLGSASLDEIEGALERLIQTYPVSRRLTPSVQHDRDEIRVLFVDDSGTVRASYGHLLTANGYHTETAENVSEAMTLALSQPFDMAIIDYMMPGATGDELCRQIKAEPSTQHIVCSILTSEYSEAIVRQCLDSGAVEFMFKSEANELFLSRVQSLAGIVRASRTMENERRRLKGILSSVADGVFGIDASGRITFINPAACQILGYSSGKDLVGQEPCQLFLRNPNESSQVPPDNTLLSAHRQGTSLKSWESLFWKRNGQSIAVECSLTPMHIEGIREGTVVAFRDISERKLFEEELRWQANHDSLTKLLNRHYFEKQLEQEVARHSRSRNESGMEGECSAMLYIDIDRFKYINDTAGHTAGDQMLIEIGHQIQTRLRGSDTVARLGGDEFAIILRDIVEEEAFLAGNRFRKIVDEYLFSYKGRQYPVSASLGAALIDGSVLPGEILANADLACHIAKGKGGNQVHVFGPEDEDRMTMNADLGWSTRIRTALEKGGFELSFQPIVSLPVLISANLPEEGLTESPSPWKALKQDGKGNPVLFEVLIRLREGDTLIAPDAFLPTAERFHLMPDIDRWVIAKSLQKLAEERAEGRDIRFSINLSGKTLVDQRLIGDIKRLLSENRVRGEWVTFEITETSAITNLEVAKRLIAGLKEVGCKFALDDFGSGFSSFGHLKHLDVDYVKIDGLFTQGVLTDSMDRAVVQSINDIAHSFGKQTVAEYVDNREILRILQECGVDYAQGYFISKPRPGLGFN
jgi:diguanylate cyclase (GGDEF)-like protein/PAS domain S-box-containing protein